MKSLDKILECVQGAEREPFKPQLVYVPEGDFVEYFGSDQTHYAERIDQLVTVYRSEATGQMIGFKIKSVREILSLIQEVSEQPCAYQVHVRGDEINVGMVFLGASAHQAATEQTRKVLVAAAAISRDLPATAFPNLEAMSA